MSAMGEWFRRVSYLLNRSRHDDELRAEMAAHREMMGDPRQFGNILRLREESRDVWGWTWLDNGQRDVRFAARTLWRTPGFAAIVIMSLALSTGATTAIFSIVNGVLLRPLPFPDADRLVQVNEINRMGGLGAVMYGDMQAFRAESTTVERFSAYEPATRLLETPNGSERVTAVLTDRDFFPMLRVQPLIGRTYQAGDPASFVVLSAGLWQRLFDRDPAVLGRTIAISRQSLGSCAAPVGDCAARGHRHRRDAGRLSVSLRCGNRVQGFDAKACALV